MIYKCGCIGSMPTNCYLITDEATNKSALIDCPEYSQDMLDFVGDADLEYILLTHGHFDHIGGVCDIKEKFGCKVAISKEDEPMLTSSRQSLAAFTGAVHKNAQSDIMLTDGDVIQLGSTEIKVMSTPGHTKGGLCFIVGDCIFSGDTLFYLSCGRTDFPGGSTTEIKQSLKRLAQLDGNYKVYSGHGEFSTLDFERQHNQYMR